MRLSNAWVRLTPPTNLNWILYSRPVSGSVKYGKGLVDVFIIDLGIVGFTRWRKIIPELIAANVMRHHIRGAGLFVHAMSHNLGQALAMSLVSKVSPAKAPALII